VNGELRLLLIEYNSTATPDRVFDSVRDNRVDGLQRQTVTQRNGPQSDQRLSDRLIATFLQRVNLTKRVCHRKRFRPTACTTEDTLAANDTTVQVVTRWEQTAFDGPDTGNRTKQTVNIYVDSCYIFCFQRFEQFFSNRVVLVFR